MFREVEIQCPFCFESQTAFVDPGEMGESVIVIDCTVCCHPIDLQVDRDPESDEISIQVGRSN